MASSGIFSLVMRRRWIVVATALFAAALGAISAGQIEPTYQSRARLLVGPLTADQAALRAWSQLTRTYAELTRSQGVLKGAAEKLDFPTSTRRIGAKTSVFANEITRIVDVAVRDSDPERARDIANALADTLLEFGTPAQAPDVEGADPAAVGSALTVVEAANLPLGPVAPNEELITMLAALAGALAALVGIVVFDRAGELVGDPERLREHDDLDVLADLAGVDLRLAGREGLLAPIPPKLEADLRVMGWRLLHGGLGREVHTVLVVPSSEGDGCAIVATLMARVLSSLVGSVCVVDGAGGSGSLTERLGIEGAQGAGDLTRPDGEVTLVDLARPLAGGVSVVGVGNEPTDRAGLAEDPSRLFDPDGSMPLRVVIAPTLAGSIRPVTWGLLADVVVLHAVREETPLAAVHSLASSLKLAGSAVSGVLLSPPRPPWARRLLGRLRKNLGRKRPARHAVGGRRDGANGAKRPGKRPTPPARPTRSV